MQRILRNSAYIGKVLWKGVEYDGNHEPIIKHATWLKVQSRLDQNRKGLKSSKHEHYLKSAPVFCVCGRRMSFTLKLQMYGYFYCLANCGQPYAPVDAIEAEITDLYHYVQIPPELAGQLREQLEATLAEQETTHTSESVFLGKRLQRLLLERDKLLQAYYADAIPLDQFKKEQKRIAVETAELEAQLEAQRVPVAEARETLDLALKLAERLDKTYEQAYEPARVQLNEAILQRIIVENKHISGYEFAQPFQTLLVESFPKTHILWRSGGQF